MEEPNYHLERVVQSRSDALEDFDGPLNVILLLLSRNKIEIQNVSLTQILDQYLRYLDEQKRMDMEIASEFIAMASYLMYLKTKMLLSVADREEAQSEMDQLIRSLEERQRREAYLQIQAAAAVLAVRSDVGRGMFPKPPEPLRRDPTYAYRHDASDLLAALAAMAEREEKPLPPPVRNFAGLVGAEPFPVVAKAAQVLRRLAAAGKARFRALFRGSRSRSEIVATFLAILELCKLHAVSLGGQEETLVTFEKMPDDAGALLREGEEQEANHGPT